MEELLLERWDESLDELPLPVAGVDDEFPELSLEPLVDGVVLVELDEPLLVVDEPELEVWLLSVLELFVGTTGTFNTSPSLIPPFPAQVPAI